MKHIVLKTEIAICTALMCLLYGCMGAPGENTSSTPRQNTMPKVTASSEKQSVSSEKPLGGKTDASSADTKQEKTSVSEKSSSKPDSKTVTVTIDASKAKTKSFTINSKKVEIKAGESAFDALKSCCEANNLKLIASGLGNNVYVSSVGGVSEFASGSQSGWIYSVNGSVASAGCGNYKLAGGETIKWMYTLDMGRTEAKEH